MWKGSQGVYDGYADFDVSVRQPHGDAEQATNCTLISKIWEQSLGYRHTFKNHHIDRNHIDATILMEIIHQDPNSALRQ